MVACKVENNTPQDIFWMYVFRLEEGEYPNVRIWFMPRPCMHCDNAPCVKVCPVGARYMRHDGLVASDFDRCIGCRYCQVACPYGVTQFNWKKPADNYYLDWGDRELHSVTGGAVPPYKNPDLVEAYGSEKRHISGGGQRVGVTEKCTFCVHSVEKGMNPACVANCPVQALHFGDFGDSNSEVSRLLAQVPSHRLLEELGTEPKVYYLGKMPSIGRARQIEEIPIPAKR